MIGPRLFAVAAALLGIAAAFAGSPYRSRGRIDVAELGGVVARGEDHVSAMELAGWIRDRRAGVHVIDVRPASEFAVYRIPTAENVPLDVIEHSHFAATDTLVLYSGGGAHAAQAWVFLRALGYRHVFFLSGGLDEWLDEVMNPVRSTDLTRYFGGVPGPAGSPARTAPPAAADRAARAIRRGC